MASDWIKRTVADGIIRFTSIAVRVLVVVAFVLMFSPIAIAAYALSVDSEMRAFARVTVLGVMAVLTTTLFLVGLVHGIYGWAKKHRTKD